MHSRGVQKMQYSSPIRNLNALRHQHLPRPFEIKQSLPFACRKWCFETREVICVEFSHGLVAYRVDGGNADSLTGSVLMPRLFCEDGVLASGQTSSVAQWKISTVRPAVIAALVDLQQSVRPFDSPVCGAVCRACQVRFSLGSCKKRCADVLRA
jgi:hypothetical protein